ncbi:VOC family protein [Rummeliibacillus pycnus]|uniref:VOC family protein n=1 Tax=Rummeliibacillus pycnus TaxID=101070 RepID=UPI003D27C01F
MIKKLYETHLQVKDLKAAINFYQDKLELELGYATEKNAFFWIGEPGYQMLGLWLVPVSSEIEKRHFAFEVEFEFLIHSIQWLQDQGIEVIGSQGKGNEEPIVQAWMPAASIYFLDPDGNKLEFISMLNDDPRELDFVPYLSEWNKLSNS